MLSYVSTNGILGRFCVKQAKPHSGYDTILMEVGGCSLVMVTVDCGGSAVSVSEGTSSTRFKMPVGVLLWHSSTIPLV